MAEPIAVTDQDFEEQVLKSSTPVLVDFWAVWCGPCKMIAPVLEQIAQETEGVLTIAKLDVDNNPGVPSKFGIRSIPTMVLFKDGEAVDQIVGFRPKPQLLKQLAQHVDGLAA
jgi:thioredoxin 1